MKREDIKAGGIYYQQDVNGHRYIFRATEDLYKCTVLTFISAEFYINHCNFTQEEDFPSTRPATQDEIDWFEFCEIHCEYFDKEYALKYSEPRLLREFVEQYLTEE